MMLICFLATFTCPDVGVMLTLISKSITINTKLNKCWEVINMALVTTTEMFKKAYNGGYAIGALNVNNMEIV